MLVTTTERISGQEYEIIGEVFGLTTRSKNMFKDLGAGLKSVVGGEIKGYTDMQREARDQAIERLKAEASKLGADAVVMMRFDSGTIGTTCNLSWLTEQLLNTSKSCNQKDEDLFL